MSDYSSSYWRDRVDNLKNQVSTADVLEHYNIRLPTRSRKCHYSCPLHGDGQDRKDSAMYYPENDSTYCWGCAEYRDQIDFVVDFEGCEFKEAVKYLERTFGVDDVPSIYDYSSSGFDSDDEDEDEPRNELVDELDAIFDGSDDPSDPNHPENHRSIERMIERLVEDRRDEWSDPDRALRLFHVLDQTVYRWREGDISEDRAASILSDLREKVHRLQSS